MNYRKARTVAREGGEGVMGGGGGKKRNGVEWAFQRNSEVETHLTKVFLLSWKRKSQKKGKRKGNRRGGKTKVQKGPRRGAETIEGAKDPQKAGLGGD